MCNSLFCYFHKAASGLIWGQEMETPSLPQRGKKDYSLENRTIWKMLSKKINK